MKKSLLILLAIIFAISLNTQAEDFSAVNNGGTIYYNITSSTSPLTVAVTYRGSSSGSYSNEYSGVVSIPDSVLYSGNYYNVTSIGNTAFNGCSGLTSITIPNSVTSIGSSAFSNCYGLTSITIPNSVTSIGGGAFKGCSGLTSITIPDSVTSIGDYTFQGCSGLTSITIPDSVTSIGDYTFHGCSGLTSITIPNSVTSIGEWAFANCSGLTSITIPNSVTSISHGAFRGCSGLTSITIPNSVTSIGNHAFENCINLDTVYFNANNCTTMGTSTYYVFTGCVNFRTLIIGDSVQNIPSYAFCNCNSLTSITSKAINPPAVQGNSFFGVTKTIPFYVPCNSLTIYQLAEFWSDFINYKCDPISLEDEIKINISTKIYPNPTYGNIKLEVEGLNTEADVLVYDMVGRVVQRHSLNKGKNDLEIDLSGYAKGVYSVRIVNESVNQTLKLVVQ